MSLFIQPEYQKYFKTRQFAESLCQTAHFVVGDLNFLNAQLNSGSADTNTERHNFLITEGSEINATQLSAIRPDHIFNSNELNQNSQRLIAAIESEILFIEGQQKIQVAKADIEHKRADLERLNSFLSDQSEEKQTALSQFHFVEQNKKNKEKKLLYFLDYLNSEYKKSDFILDVLRTIWSDLKKVGSFYRIGFVIQNHKHSSYIIEFDGKIDRAKTVAYEHAIQKQHLNQFLADAYKRPVGKLISFLTEQDANQFIFFFEIQGSELIAADLDTYMSERISLLSIMVQRWYSESTEIQVLQQWQQLFRSYTNPVHVVDSEFNLVQSNYSSDQQKMNLQLSGKKCYAALAGRSQPCNGCPIKSNSSEEISKKRNQVQMNDSDFDVIISDFLIEEKKYFFMIYENTNEISQLKSNLIQAEKMATIGQLSNHLSHELNNPLTGLKLYAEMLLTTNRLQSVIYENDMQEVLKAISRSQAILADLSQFANETQTQLEIINFSEIIKKTMTLLKSILRNHRIFIDLKNTTVLAQPTYLQQILFNLIKNACQAMPEKGTLKIYEIDNDQFNDFIIEDNGPGLPAYVADQIFKPFFTTKEAGQGTGLGLFISQKLMNRMNGELIYNKQFTKGTQFILRFKKC